MVMGMKRRSQEYARAYDDGRRTSHSFTSFTFFPTFSSFNMIEAAPERTPEQLKQEAKDCKRCEQWRDELVRESASS
jgi:hypothetical protein